MTAPVPPSLAELLHLCGDSRGPWYPARYAGDRARLDEALTQLRLAGLVRLTDWQRDLGQGYELTDAGRAVLADPRAFDLLRAGSIPAAKPVRPVRQPTRDNDAPVDHGPWTVTNVLVAAMLAVYVLGYPLAQAAGVTANTYLKTGQSPLLEVLALSPAAVAAGQWWRLLTYALVHIGIVHLLLNVYGHMIVGPVTESMYGRGRFLLLYLLSAFGGALGAILTSRPVAGSSGAWCGMIGGQVAYMLFHRHRYMRESVREWWSGTFKTIVLMVIISVLPRVSWEGHLGGGIAGFLVGVFLNLQASRRSWGHWFGLFGLVFLTALGLGYVAGRSDKSDFTARIAPVTATAQERANALLDDVADPLCGTRPDKRDAANVARALAELADAKQQATRALGVTFSRAYMAAPVEAAREATEKSLIALVQLLGEYEECLRRGDTWMSHDEMHLLATRDQALEADIRRRQLTRSLQKN